MAVECNIARHAFKTNRTVDVGGVTVSLKVMFRPFTDA
jgi:hypothetical protein